MKLQQLWPQNITLHLHKRSTQFANHYLHVVDHPCLSGPQEQWLQCTAVRQLQKNLGQERSAVFTFYYTFCDEARMLLQHCRSPGPFPEPRLTESLSTVAYGGA